MDGDFGSCGESKTQRKECKEVEDGEDELRKLHDGGI